MAKAKKKYKKKALPANFGELATPERKRQFGNVKTEVVHGPRGTVLHKRDRAMITCQLDIYKYRGQLDDPLHDAAMIYRNAFLFHVFGLKVDDNASGGRADEISKKNAKLHSEKLLAEAHGILSQPQAAVVRAVCGLDDSAGNTYRFETLVRGLEKLATLWKT